MVSQNPHAILKKAAVAVGGWDKLQEKLDCSRQAIWYWETQRRTPRTPIILKCLSIIEKETRRREAEAAAAAEEFR